MPGDPNGNRAQQAAYYQQFIAKIPGTYDGGDTKLRGKTWVQIYQALLRDFPALSPKDVGDKVVGLWAVQTEAQKIAATAGELGPFTSAAESAAAKTNFAAGIPDPLRAVAEAIAAVGGGIGAFYDAVTDGKLWRSVGWVLLGVVLLIVAITLWIGPAAVTHGPTGMVARGVGKATA